MEPIVILDRQVYAALGPIYDAAMDESRWCEALDAVTTASEGVAAALLVVERGDNPYNVRALGGAYGTSPPDRIRHYVEHLAHLEAAEWQALAQQRARQLFLDTEVTEAAVLDRRADYRYLRDLVGMGRRVGARLNESPAWYDAVTVAYHARHQAIPAQSLARIGPLLPHLAKAVEMGRAFSRLRACYAAVLAVLDKVHVGLAIAGASGEVIVRNSEAERILGLGDGMVLGRDRRILCRDPDQTALLAACIGEAARTARGEADRPESLIAVPRPSGARPFLLEVAPVSDSAGELEANLSGALVTLIDPEHTPRLDIARFACLYGLTAAESEVCAHMVRGLTGPAIAELRSTKLETVKSQMAAVLAKTGVARRSELIRLVVRTLPPIG